jgi:hypothetical protein
MKNRRTVTIVVAAIVLAFAAFFLWGCSWGGYGDDHHQCYGGHGHGGHGYHHGYGVAPGPVPGGAPQAAPAAPATPTPPMAPPPQQVGGFQTQPYYAPAAQPVNSYRPAYSHASNQGGGGYCAECEAASQRARSFSSTPRSQW